MRRMVVLVCLPVVGALALASPVLADDFSQGQGAAAAANWKAEVQNPGYGLSSTVASSTADGISFNLQTIAADHSQSAGATSFLATTHPGDLHGDLTGKTVSATFTITGTAPVFTYYYSCGATPPSVRLFFEGNTQGKFNPADYWWSNPVSATLASAVGNQITLTASIGDPSAWSDYYGQYGTAAPDGFAAAAADVTKIGLSFGGGCFFSNGVGVSSGSATFTLEDFSAS